MRGHRLRDRIGCTGCLVLVLALVGVGLATAATSALVQVALVALVALVSWIWWRERRGLHRTVREFREAHREDGRDLVLVYSESPQWQRYIEDRWLPRWGDRAVVLNRSSPRWTERPEAALWRRMTGSGDHTPAAIVIPPRGKPRLFRFHEAFVEYAHGRAARLHALEIELSLALVASERGGGGAP